MAALSESDWKEELLLGEPFSKLAINQDNTIVVASTGSYVEILSENAKQKRRILDHESNVVGVFFIGSKKLVTVTSNGEITDYLFGDDIVEMPQKIESRRVTAFPVVAAFVQKSILMENEQDEKKVEMWLVVRKSDSKKEKLLDVCYIRGDASLKKVVEVPATLKMEQIVIDDNIIAYCQNHEVKVILLNSSREVDKKWSFAQKTSERNLDESFYKFIRIAANGNHLAVATAYGQIYQWSNLTTNGVSDTYHTTHWHKVAPSLAISPFGNVLSAGAECALARFTKGEKKPKVLTRLIAPIVGLILSPDSSTVVLLMENNSIHTVLLATMAIQTSFITIEHCSRSLNTLFLTDPSTNTDFVMNNKPGSIQWLNAALKKSTHTFAVTLENAVDGDMSLVGIKPAYRDVLNMAINKKYFATIEKTIHFETDNHLRFWKRDPTNFSNNSLVSTVAVAKDVVFVSVCRKDSANYEKTVITASTSGTISVWEFSANDQDVREDLSRQRNWQETPINAVSSIHPYGRFATAHGKHVVLWNLENMKVIDVLSCDDEVESIEFNDSMLIIGTKGSVISWNTLGLFVSFKINQKVGVVVSAAGCYVYDDHQIMRFHPERGNVLSMQKLSTKINDLIVYGSVSHPMFVAKTDKGILCYHKPQAKKSTTDSKPVVKTPFRELSKSKSNSSLDGTTQDEKLVRQPRPMAAQLFAGPVYSLPPISFIAPLFITKALLQPVHDKH